MLDWALILTIIIAVLLVWRPSSNGFVLHVRVPQQKGWSYLDLPTAVTLACLFMGFIVSSGALAGQSAPSAGADVPTAELRCNAKPYGATEDQLNAYLDAVLPHLGGNKPYVRSVAEGFVQSVCRMKFGTADRMTLHDYGITDQQILATDPATLTRQLLEACGYQIRGSAEAYEIEKRMKLESQDHELYFPTVCSASICSGSHDLAHRFSSLADCKRYLERLNLPYNTSTSDQSAYGYCAHEEPARRAVQ